MNDIAPRAPRPLAFLSLALIVPLMLASILFWLSDEYGRWNGLRENADLSFQRRGVLIGMLSEIRAAETSQRGYVITGDREFLRNYEGWHRQVERSLNSATILYQNEPQHRTAIAHLRRVADAKFAEMNEVFDIYGKSGAQPARARIADGEGKRLMQQLQHWLGRITDQEQANGAARLASHQARTYALQRILWILFVTGSLLLAVALFAFWRQRLARYRAELKGYESAKRNETILDSTIDAIIIVNPSGSIETINQAASAMLGYARTSLARRNFDIISDIAPGEGSFLDRIGLVEGKLKTPYWTDRQVKHQDGRWLPVDIALGVMPLPDGDHIVVSLRDIGERKRVEQMKDDLISTVSHELRTPLTSIVGALGLLRMDQNRHLASESAALIAIAENNSQRLIRLINDMLDVDRIDSGKLRMAWRPVDLCTTVLRAKQDNGGLGQDTQIMLEHDVPDEPLIVQGDQDRLLQVVTNLVSNAIKVTRPGGRVVLGAFRNADGRRSTVYVDDDGPGIPPEFRSRIFGRFERADYGGSVPGTGLGLAIAKDIVEQHGGELWFEDRPGGGTRFAFVLANTRPAAVSKEVGDDPKILIYESDPDIADMLSRQLTDEGYRCQIVSSVRSAREAIAADGFSMLLLDTALDDANAFQFAREVRSVEGPEQLSILMVSATDADDMSPISMDLVDWIDKPIDPARLRAAIGASLRPTGAEQPVVLHLDDDQDTLEITASVLKGVAHILKARTLDEARALLRVETPHLAILDVHLENAVGLDLLPDLVDDRAMPIPTIIYSAHDVDMDISGQINAVLVKSRTSLPDLKATVRRVFKARHGREHTG